MEILCERANLNAAQNSLTMNVDQFMGHLAERYRVSEEAVRVFAPSLGARGWSAGAVLTSRTWRLRTVDVRHDANRETCLIASYATGWSGCARS
jgi:hypothetical protein